MPQKEMAPLNKNARLSKQDMSEQSKNQTDSHIHKSPKSYASAWPTCWLQCCKSYGQPYYLAKIKTFCATFCQPANG